MEKPFARVRREGLRAFLRRHGEYWHTVGNHALDMAVMPGPRTVDGLLNSIDHYAPASDFVFALNHNDPQPLENGFDPDEAPLVDEVALNDFIIKSRGADFLWLALSEDDAASASYTILQSVGPFVETVEDHIELSASNGPRLVSIGVENFKGVGERIEIELRPITLLFGPNSAGKSTVLHALQYAREIFGRHNLDADQPVTGGSMLDLGGFKNLVHDHEVRDRDVAISLTLDVSRADWPDYGDPARGVPAYLDFGPPEDLVKSVNRAVADVRIAWSELRGAPYVKIYGVALDGHIFAAIHRDPAKSECSAILNFEHPSLVESDEGSADGAGSAFLEYRSQIGDMWRAGCDAGFFPDEVHRLVALTYPDALPPWGRAIPLNARLPDDVEIRQFAFEVERMAGLISRLIVGPGEMARNALNDMRYLGPLRRMPPRFFRRPRFRDESRWADGLAAWDELAAGDEQLIDSVNHWLARADRLNTGYRIAYRRLKEMTLERVQTLEYLLGDLPETLAGVADVVRRSMIDELRDAPVANRLVLEDIAREIDVEPHDVGIGIAQLVPVVVAALSGKGVLNVIEQPELHVHPRLQAELGDLFIDAIRTRGHRFLIETHSEHLILRLLRRIRETSKGMAHGGLALTPDDVAVYYVASEEGRTTLRKIDIDARGEFVQPWPDDFFEIDFHERFG